MRRKLRCHSHRRAALHARLPACRALRKRRLCRRNQATRTSLPAAPRPCPLLPQAVLLATGHHFFFKPAEALAVKFAASVWGGYATLAAAAGDACAALPALPARMLAAWRF